MSHWSKDAIVDRVESIVTDLSDKELINLIIEYRLILGIQDRDCLLYTSPSPRDMRRSRMPSSA